LLKLYRMEKSAC